MFQKYYIATNIASNTDVVKMEDLTEENCCIPSLQKEPKPLFKKCRGRRPRWWGQPLRFVELGMGVMSPVGAHSLWAGLCPEKLVKIKKKTKPAKSVFLVFSPAVKGKRLIKGILPLQAFMTVSLIAAGIHPDKILDWS